MNDAEMKLLFPALTSKHEWVVLADDRLFRKDHGLWWEYA